MLALGKQNDFITEELVLGQLAGSNLRPEKLGYRRLRKKACCAKLRIHLKQCDGRWCWEAWT
jgi:hypothetical protein